MSRHSMLAVAACVALIVLGSLGLIACGDSSSDDAAAYAWAVGGSGGSGTILATTDGGAHWSAQTSGTRYGLWAVSFADTSHGWAVGGYAPIPSDLESIALILATTDGGSHWVPQYETAGEPLRTVACADADHVWAAGSGQTAVILASSDGGRTWTAQHVDDPVDHIDDIAFADTTHGWAVGTVGDIGEADGTGHVLATTDGGSHWSVQATLRGGTDWGLAFADTTHGWVVGGAPWGTQGGPGGSLARVWATSDGGATWTPAPVPEGIIAYLEAVACTDSSHVWTAGAASEDIYRSTDVGLTWLASTKSVKSSGVLAIAFSDSSHGWAVTLDGSLTSIIATTDGGVSWSRQVKMGEESGIAAQLIDITCPSAAEGSGQ